MCERVYLEREIGKHNDVCVKICKLCGFAESKYTRSHKCNSNACYISTHIASLRTIGSDFYSLNAFPIEKIENVESMILQYDSVDGECVGCCSNTKLITLNGCKCKTPTICRDCFIKTISAKAMSSLSNGNYTCPTCGCALKTM